MKRISFGKRAEDNKLVAVEFNDVGLEADGSTIEVSYKTLNKCVEDGLLSKGYYLRGIQNKCYEYGDITVVNIKDDKAIIIDTAVARGLRCNNKSIHLKRSNKNDKSRGIVRISMKTVRHRDINGNIVIDSNYGVSFSRVVHDILNREISGFNLRDDEIYDIVDKESHHDREVWDNRIKSTMAFTKKEHDEYHTEYDESSNQVRCKVTSVEEMAALLRYLDKNEGVVIDKKSKK
jgi:hypothetical protein